VTRDTLPAKQYRARRSAEVTPRYFVGSVSDVCGYVLSSAPVVTFTYVEVAAVTLEAFSTHLRAYRGLFHALPKGRVIYSRPDSPVVQGGRIRVSPSSVRATRPI